jgi:NitT/TauT family transport system substrate-binding protein
MDKGRNELKKSQISIIFALAILLAACGQSGDDVNNEFTDVRLIMPFRPDVQFAPFYVAIENGYFSDSGLRVTIEHLPENEAVALVGAGEVNFAVVSGEQVLLARAQELPVVYVMAWWHDYPVAVAVPEASGIHAPVDLVGKKVGIPGLYGASYIGYRALLSADGISETETILDTIGYNQVEAMLAGQEDAIVVYANNEPIQLEDQGFPVRLIRVADYVSLASNGLITNEATRTENPDLIRKMTTAILRGIDHSISNTSEAYEISKGFVEGLDQVESEVLRDVLEESISFWESDKPGASEPEAWRNMHDILLEMGLLETSLDIQDAYSNEYLERND